MPNPDKQYGPVGREEFDKLAGRVMGLTNAIRALIEIAPDPAAAVEAVEKCFDVEAAMGQNWEYTDAYERDGLSNCLAELKMPIRHDWLTDSDPEGRILKAQQQYRDRQEALNAAAMERLLRPAQPDEPASGEPTSDPA